MLLLNVLVLLSVVWLTTRFSQLYKKRRQLTKKFDQLPGPTPSPIHPMIDTINLMLIDGLSIKQKRVATYVMVYELALAQCKVFNEAGLFRIYLGFKPVVMLFSPENVEAIMQSTTVLNKSEEYRVFEPWIGEGLITSKPPKWQFRRKLLTPAFHFRILNDFAPIMNKEATKLVRKLNNIKYERSFDVTPVIALCTLDTICETAMGVNIDSQTNSDDSGYVRALYEVGEAGLFRVTRPWLWPDFIFYLTQAGRRFAKANKLTHDFAYKVILDRRDEWRQIIKEIGNESHKISFDDLLASPKFKLSSTNRRLAFMDLMMYQHLIEGSMTLEDIREEVDTFMFAGHDTTAWNISWTLYLLGLHPDIQDRVRHELDEVLASEVASEEFEFIDPLEPRQMINSRLKLADITTDQLAQMKYLEMVIKEALRLFPSVPFVARQMTEDLVVGGKYLIPEGSTCCVFTHALHTNPSVYHRPEIFDPDRFLPENINKRHPFSYIPFSAGARNCIGQKFARMEVKIILAKIIRNFRVETHLERDKLKLVGELVLRSIEGLPIKLLPRFVE